MFTDKRVMVGTGVVVVCGLVAVYVVLRPLRVGRPVTPREYGELLVRSVEARRYFYRNQTRGINPTRLKNLVGAIKVEVINPSQPGNSGPYVEIRALQGVHLLLTSIQQSANCDNAELQELVASKLIEVNQRLEEAHLLTDCLGQGKRTIEECMSEAANRRLRAEQNRQE